MRQEAERRTRTREVVGCGGGERGHAGVVVLVVVVAVALLLVVVVRISKGCSNDEVESVGGGEGRGGVVRREAAPARPRA